MPWVYILHLEQNHYHARHYSGSTIDLRRRLTEHATGGGSVYTRRLFELGIEWTLGGLYQLRTDELITIRRAERLLKNQHHAPKYCRLCTGRRIKSLPGCQDVPLALGSIAVDSRTIRATAQTNGTVIPPLPPEAK